MRRAPAASLAVMALMTGCSGADLGIPQDPLVTTLTATPTASPTAATPAPTRRFESSRAMRTVRHLAGTIGPRLATGPAYRRATAYVGARLTAEGYVVRRQAFPVPAGDSWGVPVEAG